MPRRMIGRPKRYVQSRFGLFAAMSPLEAWCDDGSASRYVEIRCNNNGNDGSWSAMTSPDEVRRLGQWLMAAAAWMESCDSIGPGAREVSEQLYKGEG
jgi:hypothetical protein